MKKIVLSILFCAVALLAFAKVDKQAQFSEASTAYAEGDYIKAAQIFNAILTKDEVSSEIYYNLANCYFKQDKLALAILNYNRALLLSPSDENIKHNLEIAETKTTNRIEQLPQFFLEKVVVYLRQLLSSNQWAVWALVILSVAITCMICFYFSHRSWVRKITFTTALVSIIFFAVAISFSSSQKSIIMDSNMAIVMQNAVAVKSSPSQGGTDLFVLNEGVKVDVVEKVGEWSEVVVASGNSGWLQTKTIQYIKP